ncbi:MAG: YihY/virulence factor BrkB family protein [Ruminococcaceae bacterium]|nr:YihY/virulence factor BrkB family protein [Oscillospiraceae bacterium]
MAKILENTVDKMNDLFKIKPTDGIIKYTLKNLFVRFDSHDVAQNAGQLAYFGLLSVFPFIIFVNALIGRMGLSKDFVVEILAELFPLQIATIIGDYVEYVSGLGNRFGIISFGVVVELFSASKWVRAISGAINKAYDIRDNRFFLVRLILSVFLTLILGVAIFLCLSAVTIGREWIYKIILLLEIPVDWLNKISVGKWTVVFGAFLLILLLVYYAVPLKRVKLRYVFPGAIFAIICNFLLTYGFSIYMAYFENFSILYGSLGAVLLLALWLYFVGMFIILGAEINSISEERKYFLAATKNAKK